MNSNKLLRYGLRLNNSILQRTQVTHYSSNFRRPSLITKVDQLAEVKNSFFHNRSQLTDTEWQNLKDLLIKNYKHINRNNVDAIIVGICNDSQQLTLAKSYINHLRDSGVEPNDATLLKLLRIYNSAYHANGGSLSLQEQEEILDIYKNIRRKHDILDSLSCENLIHGLVATKQWREGLELMDMMKLTAAPSLPVFNEMIIKAFSVQDIELGWKLLHQMLDERKQPKCEVFLAYLQLISKDLKTLPEELEKLFTFLKTYDVVITEKTANAINEVARKHRKLVSVSFTKLKRHGKCASCGVHLENVSLSSEDFHKLQDSFLEKVLIRKDVFQKSTPEELKRFSEYIERTGPYDCVIDGLNVAYSMGSKKPPQALANLLFSVVKYFKSKNKHVLVLGRNHMNKWPYRTMQYVKDNAAVFLANDISQDDPFMLYATLKSGQTTDFFSRDFMRQHAHLLGPDLKVIFRRWQQEHQYSLITQTESGKILVKEPVRHLICAHKVQNQWHVPYKKEYQPNVPDSFDIPEHWMCIKINK
ncbi:mitochondrial ribonuclease P catalytic subunit [Musca autumnalis]|uniref:mitochondrial ribonuclease P catalytic subunit n=1 Tax=Musca autumnalis TaxID=221902 RepID=UPI003CE83FFF